MYRLNNDVHLGMADYYWGMSPEKIHTVLGSCISVTIWNPVKKSGGMCHFLLPRSRAYDKGESDARYCEDSVGLLAENISSENLKPSCYQVKIFGGAAMFEESMSRVGESNIRCAEEMLCSHGFVIAARHVGGSSSRHIIFELETGDVWVKTNKGILIPESEMDAGEDMIDTSGLRSSCVNRPMGVVYG